MDRAQKAKEYFLSGYNCSQAVMLAFADLISLTEEQIKAVTLPMGGGMGRLRQTCGGVSGAAMTAGLLFPNLSKSETYALVQEIARSFTQLNGSINCGELLTGVGLKADVNPQAEARTESYYKKRPCPDLVYDAAQILQKICEVRGRI